MTDSYILGIINLFVSIFWFGVLFSIINEYDAALPKLASLILGLIFLVISLVCFGVIK